MTWASASITASVGVPLTEKRRSSCLLRRTGVDSVSEWPAPDCSSAGATIQISSLSLRATPSSSFRPRAFTPSSLVSKIRIRSPMAKCRVAGNRAQNCAIFATAWRFLHNLFVSSC